MSEEYTPLEQIVRDFVEELIGLDCTNVLLTHGEQSINIISKEPTHNIPAEHKEGVRAEWRETGDDLASDLRQLGYEYEICLIGIDSVRLIRTE